MNVYREGRGGNHWMAGALIGLLIAVVLSFAAASEEDPWVCRFAWNGHNGQVYALCFSPDGTLLASGAADGTLKLWNTETAGLVRSLECGAVVFSAAFHPNGDLLAIGDGTGLVRLWDVETGIPTRDLAGPKHDVWAVAFSSDGSILAAGYGNGSIVLWNPETGEVLGRLEDHTHYVSTLLFRRAGTELISCGHDSKVCRWDLESGDLLISLYDPASHGNFYSATLTPDESAVITGAGNGAFKVWDLATGELLREVDAHAGPIEGIAFVGNGERFVTGASDVMLNQWNGMYLRDATIKAWDASRRLVMIRLPRIANADWNWMSAFAVDPDRMILASATLDDQLRLWVPTPDE